jgi:hypothetical protein
MINGPGKYSVKTAASEVTIMRPSGRRVVKVSVEQINRLDRHRDIWPRGRCARLMIDVAGPLDAMSVGARVIIETQCS